MKTKRSKSLLSGTPSWVLSLIVAVFSFILLFLLAYPFGEAIAYISYALVIVIACFFICMKNPNSLWYAPFICNIVGIMAAFGEENFYWASTLFIIISGGWILSLIGAIVGAKIGQRQIRTI